MRLAVVTTILALVLGLASACGGGDEAAFANDDFTFTHPSGWEELELDAQRDDPVATALASGVNMGPDDESGRLTVHRAGTREAVTEDDLDALVAEAAGGVARDISSGPTETTLDGRPARRAELEGVLIGGGEQAELIVALDGSDVYLLVCRYTAEAADEMKEGCAQVFETFQFAEADD